MTVLRAKQTCVLLLISLKLIRSALSLASNFTVFLESLKDIIISGLREIASAGHLTQVHPHGLIYHMTQVLRSQFLDINKWTAAKSILLSCGLFEYHISRVIVILMLDEVILMVAHH